MSIQKFVGIGIVAAGLLGASTAFGGVITLTATNSGWYDFGGNPNGTTNNINTNSSRNNWLGFDLSSVAGTITAATLEVDSDPSNNSGQAFTWSEVTTPYASLGVVSSVAIYNDLGSGVVFGLGTHAAGTINNFALTGAALTSLNATSGSWAIGGSHTGSGNAFGFTNGISDGHHLKLVLTTTQVTEPSIIGLFGLTLTCLGFMSRRRKAV